MTYVTELPLDSVAYLHDDTLEGLLSAVFLSYARHENPEDIVAQKRLKFSVNLVYQRTGKFGSGLGPKLESVCK